MTEPEILSRLQERADLLGPESLEAQALHLIASLQSQFKPYPRPERDQRAVGVGRILGNRSLGERGVRE